MTRIWNVFVPVLFCAVSVLFVAPPARAQVVEGSQENVILLMLDGVRWQEVFNGDDRGLIFKNLFQLVKSDGVIFGNPADGPQMEVSNSVNLSLPGYQSIMAGETQSCWTNSCGRIGVETLQERIMRELGLPPLQVATIASWEQMPNAVEHIEGTTFVNAAFQRLADGTSDAEFDAINKAQESDVPPWAGARFDRYTWAHSMHYIAKYHPRFMFISLNDSDEWGHKGEWEQYVNSLKQYDVYINALVATLKQMGDYGQRTTLIVTTDHGRGDGGSWTDHGPIWPSSKYVWLYGQPSLSHRATSSEPNSSENENDARGYAHVDIRPTIEAALGLKPIECRNCGRVIREVVPSFTPASE